MTQTGEEDAQESEDLGRRADSGARAAVGQALVDADRWRQADDGIHRRLCEAARNQSQ